MMKQLSNVSGGETYIICPQGKYSERLRQTNKKNAKRESQAGSTDTALFRDKVRLCSGKVS